MSPTPQERDAMQEQPEDREVTRERIARLTREAHALRDVLDARRVDPALGRFVPDHLKRIEIPPIHREPAAGEPQPDSIATPDFAKALESLKRMRRESDDWFRVRDALSLAELRVSSLEGERDQAHHKVGALYQRVTELEETGAALLTLLATEHQAGGLGLCLRDDTAAAISAFRVVLRPTTKKSDEAS